MLSKVSLAALLMSLSSASAGVAYDGTCTNYLRDAGVLPLQGDCDEGLVCEKVPGKFEGICMPDPVAYNSCGLQYYEDECSPGECMLGTYCDTSDNTCKPGAEPSGVNYGLCECNDRENPDEWETLCRSEDNPCEVAGLQSNCCEGFICTLSNKIYPTCSPDPFFDTTESCCSPIKTKECMPGDCCEGSWCRLNGGKGKCIAGEEPSGMHDGLCRTDEALLHCLGNVAAIHGDPHVRTFDELKYNCMGAGEFVIFKSWVKYFEIHGRFEHLFNPAHPSTHQFTNVQGLVFQGEPGVTKIQMNLEEIENNKSHLINGCPLNIYFDGEMQDGSVGSLTTGTVWEADGVKWTRTATTIDLEYDSGIAVQITVTGSPTNKWGCMINTYLCLPSDEPDYYAQVTGLLGTPNGKKEDDWVMANGVKWEKEVNSDDDDGFEFCTKNYCINEESESLFDYFGDETFEMYKKCDSVPPPPIDISDAPAEIIEFCDGDQWCLEDGVMAGIGAAEDSRNSEDFIDCVKTGVIGFAPPPPAIPNCPSVQLMNGHEINYKKTPLEVVEENTDSVKLKLLNPFSTGLSNMFVKYVQEPHQSDKCEKYDVIYSNFETTFTAYCMEHVAETVVYVYASDESFATTDKAPECCHAPEDLPTVEYTFKVKCSPECPEAVVSETRRAHRALREEWEAHFGEYKGGRKF